jgi:hypothetical protein
MPDPTSYVSGHPTKPVDTVESLRALVDQKDRHIAELTVKLDALVAKYEPAPEPEAEAVVETGTEENLGLEEIHEKELDDEV